MKYLILAAVCLVIGACGRSATSSDISIQVMNANDGTRCHVIMQDGRAVGGSCQN